MEYFKTTKRNGMSFHGHVKYEVGKTVCLKECGNPQLCTEDVLHASKRAIDALLYAQSLDCNLFVVEGVSVVHDSHKDGFFSLKVVREVPDSQRDDIFGFRYTEALHPFNPMQNVHDVNETDIENIKKWVPVRNSVGNSVWESVGNLVANLVRNSVWDSVGASVWDSVGDSVGDSVWDSVRNSVGNSVWESVWAYIGSLFPAIQKWEYMEHEKGVYPFQPAVDLWKRGFIPVQIEDEWRLYHPVQGMKATCVYPKGDGE